MYVLSVEDIDLMIMLASQHTTLSEIGRHEKQMDKLIAMGILRPGGGVLALTELGLKTANALLGRCLGSSVDTPLEAEAAVIAESEAAAEPAAETETSAEAAAEGDAPALEAEPA